MQLRHRTSLIENLANAFMTNGSINELGQKLQKSSKKMLLAKPKQPGRVFNEFTPELLMDAGVFKTLLHDFRKIIPIGKDVKESKSGGYEFATLEAQQEVTDWFGKILHIACRDLLDGNGQFRKPLIKLLGWDSEDLEKANIDLTDPANIEGVISSFMECISCYVRGRFLEKHSELAMSPTVLILFSYYNRGYKDKFPAIIKEELDDQRKKPDDADNSDVIFDLAGEYNNSITDTDPDADETIKIVDMLFAAVKGKHDKVSLLELAYEKCVEANIHEGKFGKLVEKYLQQINPDSLALLIVPPSPVSSAGSPRSFASSPSSDWEIVSPQSPVRRARFGSSPGPQSPLGRSQTPGVGSPSPSPSPLSPSTPVTPSSGVASVRRKQSFFQMVRGESKEEKLIEEQSGIKRFTLLHEVHGKAIQVKVKAQATLVKKAKDIKDQASKMAQRLSKLGKS